MITVIKPYKKSQNKKEIHKKVIQSGDEITGSTIHYVESNYDSGQIIKQIEIPIFPTDTMDSLEERIKTQEKQLYIDSIHEIINDWKR